MNSAQKPASRLPQPTAGLQSRSSSTPTSSAASSRTHSTEDLHVGGASSVSETFHVGDRVVVGGTKTGVIAFLGEVHFSTGEWAGVVLDSPVGKNDGSIGGQRYFTCTGNCGIFARPTKLSHFPNLSTNASNSAVSSISNLSDNKLVKTSSVKNVDDTSPESVSGVEKTVASKTSVIPVPHRAVVSSTQDHAGSSGSGMVTSPPVMTSSFNDASSVTNTESRYGRLRVGDRVTISGSKNGTVRYVGPTEFAHGVWVGIELDDALGKNDGSVGNKRYFHCAPMFGLFAPQHKVTALPGGNSSSRRSSLARYGDGGLSCHRASSQESISSIGSTSSTSRGISGGRMRLGITSLSGGHTSKSRSVSSSVTPTLTGLQKALKEKQEHIEQLLKERDMERSEFARTASQIDELECKLATQKSDHMRFANETDELTRRLRSRIDFLEHNKSELQQQLVDEKRKVEDLQFTAEEAAIDKADLEAQLEKEARRVKELEQRVLKEDEITERLRRDLDSLQVSYTPELSGLLPASGDAAAPADGTNKRLSVLLDRIKSAKTQGVCESCRQLVDIDSILDEVTDFWDPANEVSRLKLQLQTALSERGVFEIKLSQMNEDLKQMLADKSDAVKEKTDAVGRYEKMAAERDRLIRDRAGIQKQLQDKERQFDDILREFDQSKKSQSNQMEDLQKRTANLQIEAESLLKVQQQLTPYKQQVTILNDRVQQLTAERDSLKAEISQLKTSIQPELLEASFKVQMEEHQKRHNQFVKEFESEKLKLLGVIESARLSSERKDKEIEKLKLELSSLRSAPASNNADNVKNSVNEIEIRQLRQRLQNLEKELDESRSSAKVVNNGKTLDDDKEKLLAEKESAESQVDFLNSVIVDLQRKNVSLEARLQIMESIGKSTDNITDEKLINGSMSRLLAPRLFCDICDMFDLHDTEDCPRQGMQSTSPPPSQHHGSRSDERPYCTTCEGLEAC